MKLISRRSFIASGATAGTLALIGCGKKSPKVLAKAAARFKAAMISPEPEDCARAIAELRETLKLEDPGVRRRKQFIEKLTDEDERKRLGNEIVAVLKEFEDKRFELDDPSIRTSLGNLLKQAEWRAEVVAAGLVAKEAVVKDHLTDIRWMFHKPDVKALTTLRDRVWEVLGANPGLRVLAAG